MTVPTRVARAKPQASDPLADPAKSKLIERAPDGKLGADKDGGLTKISLNLENELLAEMDARRKDMGGLSRPAIISLALKNLFRNGVMVGGQS